MTTLKDTLTDDMRNAMRSGDHTRRDTLRLILAAIKQVEKDDQTTLDDEQILGLIQKEAKKRREAIDDYVKAGRSDDADGERAELAIIEEYLPAKTSAEEITARAMAVIDEEGLSGPGAIGQVIRPLLAEFGDRADGREVNRIVRELLGA